MNAYFCSYLGGVTYLMYRLPFVECLMFGALISATDPVTVLSIFQVSFFFLFTFFIVSMNSFASCIRLVTFDHLLFFIFMFVYFGTNHIR